MLCELHFKLGHVIFVQNFVPIIINVERERA